MIEDKAKDTVGNVLNAVNLMRRHRAEAVLLVTSASHIRRARTVLEEALAQADMPAKVVPVVALDLPSFEEAAQERSRRALGRLPRSHARFQVLGLSGPAAIASANLLWRECRFRP